MAVIDLFNNKHYFSYHQILQLNDAALNEPFLSGSLCLSQDYINFFLTGQNRNPRFNKDFPAKIIQTEIEWDELVLPEDTLAQVEEIGTWIEHHDTLMYKWGFSKKLKPGYKSMFLRFPRHGQNTCGLPHRETVQYGCL